MSFWQRETSSLLVSIAEPQNGPTVASRLHVRVETSHGLTSLVTSCRAVVTESHARQTLDATALAEPVAPISNCLLAADLCSVPVRIQQCVQFRGI